MAAATIASYKPVYIGPCRVIDMVIVSGGTADTYEVPVPAAGADTGAAIHRVFGLVNSPINDGAANATVIANGISNGYLEVAVAGGAANDRHLVRFFTW